MNITSLIRAGEQTKFISLDLRVAEPGESVEFAPGDERLVVILSGRAELTLDEDNRGVVGGRADVFDGAGDAVYLPPTSSAVFLVPDDADSGGLTLAVASATPDAHAPGEARVIAAGDAA